MIISHAQSHYCIAPKEQEQAGNIQDYKDTHK
jgi:hypothetical protein